jgi:hypothetical protein
MLLYHFTAANRLDLIMAEGLRLGDVPVNGPLAPGENAVWLTSSPSAEDHGLGEPRELTADERANMVRWKGAAPPPGARWDDKREVRITIKLSSGDRALRRFVPWARRRFDPHWLDSLILSGGGKRCADTWWLYFGVIEPSAFVDVSRFDNSAAAN